MSLHALSDFLPATMADSHRSQWLPPSADINAIKQACESMNRSTHAEALLGASAAKVLLHIGGNAAPRAFEFAKADATRRAIVFHPLPHVRDELKALIAQAPECNVVCIDELSAFSETLAALGCGDEICAYVDWPYFDLRKIEQIAAVAKIDVLIGGFEEHRIAGRHLYQALKPLTRSFRLYSHDRWNVIHWNRKQTVDVSIIVPAYNIEAYLPQCLDTLAQIRDISAEVLVIDDGSKDNSAGIVREYEQKYSHIRLISQVNGGCAAARQRGLDEARGTYVGFVDGDDWVTPGMFEKLFNCAIDTNADVALCGYVEEYTASGKSANVEEHFGSARRLFFDCYYVDPDEVVLHAPTIWRKIFRKNFLDVNRVGFHTHIRRFDDLLFNAEALLCRPHTVATSGHMYHYRLERPGQTVGFKDERLFVHFDIFKALLDRILMLGNLQAETLFKQIQISTHFWVHGLLEDSLKEKYEQGAAEDIYSSLQLLKYDRVAVLASHLSREKEAFVRSLARHIGK
ncbi:MULTISPECIES: glycosyltransferase family 2 protein [Caballeronia]|uniref:glycosyltransferase family 2 protein n=1 Tax=Caballeronia TaxID=1827195 RepID=UPI001EF5171C|nr:MULTISPECIES: glycosyltransferase [Caballeronia]MCG7402262.1 glycosyltransferase [Caballeronia zhejiangensis]MCI1047136.1 glycosyltransferase [Caballeronia zhejiangensis]